VGGGNEGDVPPLGPDPGPGPGSGRPLLWCGAARAPTVKPESGYSERGTASDLRRCAQMRAARRSWEGAGSPIPRSGDRWDPDVRSARASRAGRERVVEPSVGRASRTLGGGSGCVPLGWGSQARSPAPSRSRCVCASPPVHPGIGQGVTPVAGTFQVPMRVRVAAGPPGDRSGVTPGHPSDPATVPVLRWGCERSARIRIGPSAARRVGGQTWRGSDVAAHRVLNPRARRMPSVTGDPCTVRLSREARTISRLQPRVAGDSERRRRKVYLGRPCALAGHDETHAFHVERCLARVRAASVRDRARRPFHVERKDRQPGGPRAPRRSRGGARESARSGVGTRTGSRARQTSPASYSGVAAPVGARERVGRHQGGPVASHANAPPVASAP
jgi:hypothetical protein